MNRLLLEIQQIDPSKKCLQFIVERLQVNNYRGIQISQHNRYTKKEIIVIIEEIYNISQTNMLQIRTTDLSKRPNNISGEEKYAELTNNIAKNLSRCTQDSLRKNFFVDMHRMGLIERYNAKGKRLRPYDNGAKKYISLTPLAVNLIKTTDIFQQNLFYTQALESLMNGFGEEILNIILELPNPYITEYEIVLFVSFIYQQIGTIYYGRSEIIDFIKEFRSMSRFQRQLVIEKVKEYCNPKNFIGDKIQKRDWHNWINETQQILTLLSQMAYFVWHKIENKLYIRIGKNEIYEDKAKLNRSLIEKHNYFKEHNISKTKGFELHHVVPLCWATSRLEFQTLDNWQNLVYIDAFSHAQITQNNNANVKLTFQDDTAIFEDFSNKQIKCKKDTNILYNNNKKQVMLEYNAQLLYATNKH